MSAGLVVLSGGLDSTVCMAIAGEEAAAPPLALTFDYGQRHRIELERAAEVAAFYGSEHLVVSLDMGRWGGSALTDPNIDGPLAVDVPPDGGTVPPDGYGDVGIPATYVPARNLVFLSLAVGIAEVRERDAV